MTTNKDALDVLEDLTGIAYEAYCVGMSGIDKLSNIIENALQTQAEWQPIESAPRDENDILLFDARTNTSIVASFDNNIGFWETLEGASYGFKAFTHWMPLPAPPIAKAEQGGAE